MITNAIILLCRIVMEQEDGSLKAKWQVCHRALLQEQELVRQLDRESNGQDRPASAPPVDCASTSNRTPVSDCTSAQMRNISH